MVDKNCIIHLTDENYRKVIDLAQKDAKKEIIDKIKKILDKYRYTEIGDTEHIVKFYNEIKKLTED